MNKLKIIGALVLIAALVTFVYTTYRFGKKVEHLEQENANLTAYKKDNEKNATIDKQVRRMDIPALDNGLSNWMRND